MKVQNRMRLQNGLLILCFLALTAFVMYRMKPEITSFVVKDECGPVGTTISHSIDDEDSCANICKVSCESQDYEYHDKEFALMGATCNNCTCYCKK